MSKSWTKSIFIILGSALIAEIFVRHYDILGKDWRISAYGSSIAFLILVAETSWPVKK